MILSRQNQINDCLNCANVCGNYDIQRNRPSPNEYYFPDNPLQYLLPEPFYCEAAAGNDLVTKVSN